MTSDTCIFCGRNFSNEKMFRAHLKAELAIEHGVASLRSTESREADENQKKDGSIEPVRPCPPPGSDAWEIFN